MLVRSGTPRTRAPRDSAPSSWPDKPRNGRSSESGVRMSGSVLPRSHSLTPRTPNPELLNPWAVGCFVAILIFLTAPAVAGAQLSPPSTGGVVALDRILQGLSEQHRVLMIAAHPDDEDTQLLALLSLGYGAKAAYLSLNRGEGGQNLVGPDLG